MKYGGRRALVMSPHLQVHNHVACSTDVFPPLINLLRSILAGNRTSWTMKFRIAVYIVIYVWRLLHVLHGVQEQRFELPTPILQEQSYDRRRDVMAVAGVKRMHPQLQYNIGLGQTQ